MNEREKIIIRLKTLLDTSSDVQLKMIEKVVKDLLEDKDFKKNKSSESQNFTTNGMQSTYEDVQEGNYGTLYRHRD